MVSNTYNLTRPSRACGSWPNIIEYTDGGNMPAVFNSILDLTGYTCRRPGALAPLQESAFNDRRDGRRIT